MTDTPNPSQQQKKTGLQWRGKDFSFARPQSTTTTLPTSPTPNPHSPLSAPTTPVNNTPLGTQPHPLTPTQPEHTDTHAITPHLEQDTSRTLGPALTESKPIVNSLKSAPKQPSLPMTAMPVYTPQPALHRAVVKSPTSVLHSPPTYPLTPTQPKTNTTTVMRPVVSPPLVSDQDRKRKADQMTAVNTPEVQYKRRVVQALQSDAKSAGQPALTPFLNCEDVLTRLLPFHIFQPVDSEALVEGTHEDEQQQRYQVLLEDYHARNNTSVLTSEEQLLMERLLWSEQREELHASRELLNKYLQQLQQQRQLQQQLLHANTAQVSTSNTGPAVHSTPLSGGAVKVIATTPFTAPRNPPLNVAVMAPGMGKTGLLSAQTMALIQKVAHHNQSARPSVVTPVNVVPVPPSLSKDEHVINVLPQHKS